MSDDAFWFPHQVKVRPMRAGAGMGPRLSTSDPADAVAEVDDTHRMIRNADGVQVVSSARVTVPLDTVAPLGSEITLWPGRPAERTAAVIAISREENGDDLPSQLVLSLE